MKKELKKFSINLPLDTYIILDEFSKVTGTTKGAFISSVLDEQKKVLLDITNAVKKAQKMSVGNVTQEVKNELIKDIENLSLIHISEPTRPY